MGLKRYRNKAGMKTQEDYPVVKKDWKTTLLLLPDYTIDVKQSSVFLYHDFSVAE